MDDGGRKPVGWLPEVTFEGAANAVVQVIEESTGELVYTIRTQGNRFQPPVYALGEYTLHIGRDKPNSLSLRGMVAVTDKATADKRIVTL